MSLSVVASQGTPTFPSIEPAGDRCLVIRLGDALTPDVTRQVHALTACLLADMPPGATDVVPAFTTIALHYRPEALPRAHGSPYRQLEAMLQSLLQGGLAEVKYSGRVIEMPVCYGGEYGPDLEDVASRCNMSTDAVIALHSSVELTVLTFYFSPGTPFSGPVDPRLAVKRRNTPRTHVEAGSVAIANGLSTVYSVTSPGGWNILGRTPWSMFDLSWTPPTRFVLGDRVRFVPISPQEFVKLDERRPRVNDRPTS